VDIQTYMRFWYPYAIGFAIASSLLLLLLGGCAYAAFRAARAAREAIAETRRGTQAALLSQILTEYASPEMTAAMRDLYRFKEDHRGDFAEQFIDLYKKRNPEADKLDGHRRYAYRFFDKIARLRESHLIDPEFTDLVTFTSVGGRFLIDVLEPLQKVHGTAITHGERYDQELFDSYRRRMHKN